MRFVNWLAKIIATAVAGEVISLLKEYNEKQTKLNAITQEAKVLMGELDSAQTPEESKAILRKIANFSDAKHLL